MNQRIDGNNNIQVGRVHGPLNIGPDDPLDPDNPNLIECPSCWKLASREAAPCPKCGFPIREHFIVLERKARRQRALEKAAVCAAVCFGAVVLLSMSWCPEVLKAPLVIVTVLSGMMGYSLVSVADGLR